MNLLDLEHLMRQRPGENPEAVDLATLLQRPAWQRHAACRGMGADLFHPGRGHPTDAARAVCAGCTVTEECTNYANAVPIRLGIWGGMSYPQRRRPRRRVGLTTPIPPVSTVVDDGHSLRAIAGAVGVSEGQVRKDVAAEELRTDTQLGPDRTVGRDGKSRPAKRPTIIPANDAKQADRAQAALDVIGDDAPPPDAQRPPDRSRGVADLLRGTRATR